MTSTGSETEGRDGRGQPGSDLRHRGHTGSRGSSDGHTPTMTVHAGRWPWHPARLISRVSSPHVSVGHTRRDGPICALQRPVMAGAGWAEGRSCPSAFKVKVFCFIQMGRWTDRQARWEGRQEQPEVSFGERLEGKFKYN